MAISEYPMDSAGAYPRPNEFYPIPAKYSGGKSVFDDGTVEAARFYGGSGTLVWRLVYRGLTSAQAAIIVAHFTSSIWLEDEGMSAETFNFRERSDIGTTLHGVVRYTKFEHSHTKTWIHSIDVELTKFA